MKKKITDIGEGQDVDFHPLSFCCNQKHTLAWCAFQMFSVEFPHVSLHLSVYAFHYRYSKGREEILSSSRPTQSSGEKSGRHGP